MDDSCFLVFFNFYNVGRFALSGGAVFGQQDCVVSLDRIVADYTTLIREYFVIATAAILSDEQAERMGKLLAIACEDSTFSTLINEVDEGLFHAAEGDYAVQRNHTNNQVAIVKEFVLSAPYDNFTQLSILGTEELSTEDNSVEDKSRYTQALLDYLRQTALLRLPAGNAASAIGLHSDDATQLGFDLFADDRPIQTAWVSGQKNDKKRMLANIGAAIGGLAISSLVGTSFLSHQQSAPLVGPAVGPPPAEPAFQSEATKAETTPVSYHHDNNFDIKSLDETTLRESSRKWTEKQFQAEEDQRKAENNQIYAEKKSNPAEAERWREKSQAFLKNAQNAVKHLNNVQDEFMRRQAT